MATIVVTVDKELLRRMDASVHFDLAAEDHTREEEEGEVGEEGFTSSQINS